MNDELYVEFVEKFRKAGSDSLQYAWERNAEQILKECQERARLSLAEDRRPDPTKVGIVIEVEHTEGARAKVKVEKLFFKRTVKFCDTDFPEADIDLEQLEMDFSPARPVRGDTIAANPDADTPRAYAIIKAARELHCKAILPCLKGTVPNWERSVRVIDDKASRVVFLPEGQEDELLKSMADLGGLVVDLDGMLMQPSIQKLIHNGYAVHLFDAQGNDAGEFDFEEDMESPDCGKLLLHSDHPVIENADDFIAEPDCIIANVYC